MKYSVKYKRVFDKEENIVDISTVNEANRLSEYMRRSIDKARCEYANGETISCSSPEEMLTILLPSTN